jgi:hypothetical protein
MDKTNIQALFGKPNVSRHTILDLSTEEQSEDVVTIRLPHADLEWIKDYRHTKSMTTGDTMVTLREAWIDAINALRQVTKYEIKPRPEIVRKNENKMGRKKKPR